MIDHPHIHTYKTTKTKVWREAERLLGPLPSPSPPLNDEGEEEEEGWDIVGYEEAVEGEGRP
jgi:hypothetical protein